MALNGVIYSTSLNRGPEVPAAWERKNYHRRLCENDAASPRSYNYFMKLSVAPSVIAAFLMAAMAGAQTPAADAPAADLTKIRADLERATKTLQDWPALGRYRQENATVVMPASAEDRVVFMGDSITDGWGRRYGKFFPGKPYLNRGIGGQTTPQMLIRFRSSGPRMQ